MTGHPIPDAALAQHTAVIGKTGSGKTSTEKLAIEQVVGDGFRVCVLDTIKSDWWGITSSADGKKPGLPFRILGGPRGHVPLHSSAGTAIGQLVASGKLPLSIVDMADFPPGGVQQFFCDFAAALMRHMRGVLYLVVEEAHEVAPKERAGFGAENMAIHWAKKLATAGRSKGIRLIVATQRVQSLHNAVLGSCETLIVHRLAAPADQEPIQKWMKANADKATVEQVMGSLSSLPTGTGWLLSGEARLFEQVAFPKFATFDNTKTPSGDDDEFHVTTAPVDPDELKAIIGDAVKDAEANDPKALKAEVARLNAELRRLPAQPAGGQRADPAALDRAYKDGYETRRAQEPAAIEQARRDGAAAGLRFGRERLDILLRDGRDFVAKAETFVGHIASAVEEIDTAAVEASATQMASASTAPAIARRQSIEFQKPKSRVNSSPGPDAALPPGERRILTAIAQAGSWRHARGPHGPRRLQTILAEHLSAAPFRRRPHRQRRRSARRDRGRHRRAWG